MTALMIFSGHGTTLDLRSLGTSAAMAMLTPSRS
jgi:hypothetical protein